MLFKIRPHRLQNFRQNRRRSVVIEINSPHNFYCSPLSLYALSIMFSRSGDKFATRNYRHKSPIAMAT